MGEATDVAPLVTEVREYDGQPAVRIEATQLDLRSGGRRVDGEWFWPATGHRPDL